MWWASTHDPLSFPPENGNRYEGNWQRGVKNGSGRFFHLDHGQLFEGFWVDDVAKCGTMIDFGRDEAPQPTQFPIPEVGSSLQDPGTTPNLQTGNSRPPPATPNLIEPSRVRKCTRFCFQSGHPQGDWQYPHKACSTPKAGSTPTGQAVSQRLTAWVFSTLPRPTPVTSVQVKILDPDGVLEEALAMFKKTKEEGD